VVLSAYPPLPHLTILINKHHSQKLNHIVTHLNAAIHEKTRTSYPRVGEVESHLPKSYRETFDQDANAR
jgi:hypothetical protein